VPSPKSDTRKVNGGPEWVFPQMPYGYVVEIPPIQTLTLYNGVANGGKMMAPRFVDRIEKGGITVERMPYETLLEHMCSEQTIDGLFTCLKAAAVPERMGRRFGNLPVNIGCKTGTAQLWGAFPTNTPLDSLNFIEGFGPDKHEYYLGSLVAIMPIEKPKYTIMVAIAKEKTDEHPTYYGGRVAGDVVCDIIEFLHTNDLTLHPRVEDSGKGYRPTMIKDGKASSVARITESLCNMNYADGLDSEWCSAFVNESGSTTVQSLNIASGRVPNVQGMGLVDALFLLEQQGLEVTHSGVGRVTKQSIPHGSKITDKRRKIHLTLSI
jgi:cell division protein FtsI (penicillin-binding protein 3)